MSEYGHDDNSEYNGYKNGKSVRFEIEFIATFHLD